MLCRAFSKQDKTNENILKKKQQTNTAELDFFRDFFRDFFSEFFSKFFPSFFSNFCTVFHFFGFLFSRN